MSIGEAAAYVLAVVLLIILCRVFIKPLKNVGILLLHSALGGVGLYIFNLLFAGLGFGIGLNIATSAVCGLLGLPGLVLMILLKILFIRLP